MRKANLTGMRFGRLRVISESGRTKNGSVLWHCICDCGNEHFATSGNLTSGSIQSCGCYKKEYVADKNYTHGESKTRLHSIWRGMKRRCYCPNTRCFDRYGGRGIIVCKEWKDDFKTFRDWSMQNGYDDTKSIDRIDVNGNYEPSNCRWVTMEVQSNNKSNNVLLSMNGEKHTLSEWAKITGIDRKTISDRITRFGWSVEKALTVKARITYDHRRNKTECVDAGSS